MNWQFWLLIFIGCIFLGLAWFMFCITRGYYKLNREQRESPHYGGDVDVLYALGNPFNSYNGGIRQ